MYRRLLIVFIFLVACSKSSAATAPEPEPEYFPVPELAVENPKPLFETDGPKPTTTNFDKLPVLKDDVYEDWKLRCEPFDHQRTCDSDKDCRDVFHPANKSLKCVKPWWGDTKVCSPGWSNRKERTWRRERLRTFVRAQYFDTQQNGWKGNQAKQRAERLTSFLWLVYKRETTGRPWKRHRLNGDVRVAKTDWYRQAKRYGWSVQAGKRGELTVVPCEDCEVEPSPYYANKERWSFGLGPYGQVAPLWVATWDPQAPPEILCGEVESTESYLRAARRVWRKLRGGISCRGETYRPEVTWEILHRGIASGKLCPGKSSENFRGRAKRVDLDPDQVVTLEMLGQPIERDGQNAIAEQLYALMDAAYPTVDLVEL